MTRRAEEGLPSEYIETLQALARAAGAKPTASGYIDVKEAADLAGQDWVVFSRRVDDLIREGLVDGTEEGRSVVHGDDGVWFVRGLTVAGRSYVG
ncbi:MAG: hypothetical protein ACE5FA_07265 [Dehalococcoidia bacterium]